VIVDFHTHVFPPQVRDRREEYLRRDATFRELYSDPRSKLASAEEVLASMDEAGVDVSVIVGFAWREIDLCRQTNDYILEAATRSGGRLVAFCCVPAHAGDEARSAPGTRATTWQTAKRPACWPGPPAPMTCPCCSTSASRWDTATLAREGWTCLRSTASSRALRV
jgi:predicted TIM-barrel fold metal-dependent hydrolase